MSPRAFRNLAAALVALPALVLCVACEQPDPEEEARQARLSELRAQVDLPAVPPLERLQMPERMPDGSWSVAGLLANRADLMDSEVELTALLREVYECDRPEGSESRDGCFRAHFFVADTLRTPQRLLAVGYDERYEEQLSEGERYTLVGRYTRTHTGHVSTEDGLIVVQEIRGENIMPLEDEDEE